MRAQKDRPKGANACNYCRQRKVKCSRDTPCTNCFDHGKECVYPQPLRKRRRPDVEANQILEGRLARMEALLSRTSTIPTIDFTEGAQEPSHLEWMAREEFTPANSQHHSNAPKATPGPEIINFSINQSIQHISTQTQISKSQKDDLSTYHGAQSSIVSAHSTPYGAPSITTAASDLCSLGITGTPDDPPILRPADECHVDKEECIVAPQKINWEHHGPTSWLSICSEPGIKWVSEVTGVPDFAKSAKGLTVGWTRRLKMDSGVSKERAPEADVETAWKFSNAYFEGSYDSVFGVVFRPAFEARLQRHFEDNALDDSSWYALRNVVYASGCRILLSKDASASFAEAEQQAWKYFQNALSVFTDLIFNPSGLHAVQALALMCYYVEGLGSPSLEYMFCSSAARLAQAKGLHRQAAKAWNMPKSEMLHRSWLWWAIYCCEKHISKRSGRPSAIDDDDISCQIPTKKVQGSMINVDIFSNAVKHARISSQISRQLGTVKGFQSSTAKLMQTVTDLTKQLEEWHASLPSHLVLKVRRNCALPRLKARFDHLMYLHNAYYGSLMAIHTVFTYPWISSFFGTEKDSVFRSQVLSSTNIVAEAARNIIMTTRYIEIDAASPHWLSFSYPMFGVVNLFICTLKTPTSPTTQSDLALMEMVAGHFSHMEFVTSSEMTFPFAREVAALARAAVTGRTERSSDPAKSPSANPCDVSIDMDSDPFNSFDLDMIDFDMENWNVFSSVVTDKVPTEAENTFPYY